jgi:hypothetical protein
MISNPVLKWHKNSFEGYVSNTYDGDVVSKYRLGNKYDLFKKQCKPAH